MSKNPTQDLPIGWSTLTWLFLILFCLTRLFIWIFKPLDFSEIIYSYMPYAHLWASGVKPYLEQWYEYPPATIPLFYIPHLIDVATHGTWFPINYSQAYRGLMLLTDVALFTLVWQTLKRLNVSKSVFITSLSFYILTTTKANHFIYDTMDLTFVAAVVLGASAPILFSGMVGSFMSWIGYFLAVGLKYINAPLAMPLGLLDVPELNITHWLWHKRFWLIVRQAFMAAIPFGLAALVTWAAPLVMYRSSLQVSFVYHQIRGLQIDSTPAVIARTVHSFTKTESIIEIYKNYEITGPISTMVKWYSDKIFILALAGFLIYTSWVVISQKWSLDERNKLRLWIVLGYLLLFLSTGKVLSRPFLLWLIPVIAIYPFKTVKQQLAYMIPTVVMIFISMSKIPNWEIGIFPLPLIVGWIRSGSLLGLLGLWLAQTIQLQRHHRHQ
jgi:hypothetical protein